MYHLKKLLSEGYIRKIEKGYSLTALGKRYVDKLSLASFQPRFQPKIVTVIICKNSKGKYLFYTRKRQPFYGMIGFPYGKIHFGETIWEAARRELKEKTGLQARLTHCGDAYLTVYNKEKELITYMLCHVFKGDHPTGTLLTEIDIGSSAWKDLKEMDQKKFIPGFREMLNLTSKSKKPFFAELMLNE